MPRRSDQRAGVKPSRQPRKRGGWRQARALFLPGLLALAPAFGVLIGPSAAAAQDNVPVIDRLMAQARANPELVGIGIAIGAAVVLLIMGIERLAGRGKRQRLKELESGARAAFAAGETAPLVWRLTGDAEAGPELSELLGTALATPLSMPAVAEAFAQESAALFVQKVGALRRDGDGFTEILKTRSGRHIRVSGARDPSTGRKGRRKSTKAEAGAGSRDSVVGCALLFQHVTKDVEALEKATGHFQNLRQTVDRLPIILWQRDSSLAISDCNAAYARAVEAQSVEQVVRESRELAEGTMAENARALAYRARQSGLDQEEQQHIVVGGERRLFSLTEVPLGDSGHTLGFAIDRTEVQDVRNSLHQVSRAHEDVLERLATAIAWFSPDRRLNFYNSAFARIWDLEDDWLREEPTISEIFDRLRDRRMMPETGDFRAYKADWDGYFNNLMGPHVEHMHLPNGRTIFTIVSVHPFGGILVTFEDVTDKFAMEREYNMLVEVRQGTLDNLSEGVAVFGGDGRISLSNPKFREIWGLNGEFLASAPHARDVMASCVAQIDLEEEGVGNGTTTEAAFIDRFMGQIAGREAVEETWSLLDDRAISWSLVPLRDGGILFSCLDISDSLRAEEALRERNEALEAADALKSEFITNVSYELRTPLNTIIGFTEFLENDYFGELNDRQRDYVGGIMKASKELMTLINAVLDLTVIEAGRMVLDIQRIEPRKLLQDVALLSGEWVRDNGLTLTIKAPPETGAIFGDENRLKHVLVNLISNAIKYTPKGGTVTLSAARTSKGVELAVQDTGYGMEEEFHDEVFGKFVRGKSGAESGHGLGLALVKSMVELHHGSVRLKSAPGEGTTVTCVLPAAPDHDAAADDPDTASAEPKPAAAVVQNPTASPAAVVAPAGGPPDASAVVNGASGDTTAPTVPNGAGASSENPVEPDLVDEMAEPARGDRDVEPASSNPPSK